jgi:hypothetical protein
MSHFIVIKAFAIVMISIKARSSVVHNEICTFFAPACLAALANAS